MKFVCRSTMNITNARTVLENGVPLLSSYFRRAYRAGHKLVVREPGEQFDGVVHVITSRTTNPAKIRVLEQAAYLTKSIVQTDRPAIYDENCRVDSESLKSMIETFKQSIIHTRYYFASDEDKKTVLHREHTKDRTSGIKPFMNIWRTVAMSAHSWYPNFQDHCMCFEVGLSTNWIRAGVQSPIQVSARDGHIIYRKQNLPLFWNEESISATEQEDIVWNFLTSPTFHIPTKPNTALRQDTGFDVDIPYPNASTIILSEHENFFLNGILKGILFSFATARSHAITHGYASENGRLESPIPIQCIVIGGRQLKLICFQLNTLDMESNDGIKNFVWIRDGYLFEQPTIDEKLGKKQRLLPPTQYDDEGIELLIKFLLNGAEH